MFFLADQVTITYENFIVTGNLNVDTLDDSMDTNSFCGTFFLNKLIFGKTCFKATFRTSADVMLTNRPINFQKAAIIEHCLGDHHKKFV